MKTDYRTEWRSIISDLSSRLIGDIDSSYSGGEESPLGDPWVLTDATVEWLAEMPYEQYLTTIYWERKRSWILRDRCFSCERCGAYKDIYTRLQVHHTTYERRGNELSTDLEVLCERCHRAHHGIVA